MFETVSPPSDQGLLGLIAETAKATRIFQQESVFCEGLTFNQFTILDKVALAGGDLALARLHTFLEVEKSTTTRLVAPLIKKGLVAKKRSEMDTRAMVLRLTPQGWEARGRVLE